MKPAFDNILPSLSRSVGVLVLVGGADCNRVSQDYIYKRKVIGGYAGKDGGVLYPAYENVLPI